MPSGEKGGSLKLQISSQQSDRSRYLNQRRTTISAVVFRYSPTRTSVGYLPRGACVERETAERGRGLVALTSLEGDH